MKVKATITVEYSITDKEINGFKTRVLEYIQENIDEDYTKTLNDISNEVVEEFLSDAVANLITDFYAGYGGSTGLIYDDYFGTISFDYCGEDVSDLVQEMAQQIYDMREDE